jgi:hypothetical protein
MAPQRKRSTKMTDEHKAALAEGREQGRTIRQYLEALEENRPRRGRKRTPESMKKRLAQVENELSSDPQPLRRVQLIQERLDLQEALNTKEKPVDLAALETGFVKAAAPYSQRKQISYQAWRELGVPTDVLSKAGISRASNR